jgi:hypothetical protein
VLLGYAGENHQQRGAREREYRDQRLELNHVASPPP